MRKLKLQVQITVDGYIAGPAGEMDWMTFGWSDDVKAYVTELTEPVDCIILGRKLAQGFIPHWAGIAADPANPEYEAGRKFTDTQKVVFSKTLEEIEGKNTVLATGDLMEQINNLKSEAGGDIMAYGGAAFVSSLIKHGLVDDFYLFVNPAAIGKGLVIFKDTESTQALTLVKATPFDCGIVALHYQPKWA